MPDLLNHLLAESTESPKPFAWTADPNNVLAAAKRGKHALESMHKRFPPIDTGGASAPAEVDRARSGCQR